MKHSHLLFLCEKYIKKRFQEISDYIMEKYLEDVINEPTRIFSRHSKYAQMFSCSARGRECPPMIIYAYKRIPEKVAIAVATGWGTTKSHNSWMLSLTYEVSKVCTRLKIELIALYPTATRILQATDVSVFHPVKLSYKKAVRE